MEDLLNFSQQLMDFHQRLAPSGKIILNWYSNPRIICEFLTPGPRLRGGLGWGKKITTLARIAIAILAGIVKRCRGSAFLCLPRPHGGNRAWVGPYKNYTNDLGLLYIYLKVLINNFLFT